MRPPQRDRWGDPIPGSDTRTPIGGCLFAPGPSAENLQGANQTEADGTLYLPAGTPLPSPADKIEIRGDTYEVIGRPRVWGRAGVEIVLQMVTG
ncbi:hypothetical protein ABT336_13330 [Micromonospora sp. NPDC000207]|uniref:hypothetical protein n=1 Tax=Micromonospora sp. NPDC000207 TaxID=3154246 RepID=UPI0033323EC4